MQRMSTASPSGPLEFTPMFLLLIVVKIDGQSNGLSYLIDRFKGQRLYAHINLEKGERSELAELASNLL